MLPVITNNNKFYLLALSQNQVQCKFEPQTNKVEIYTEATEDSVDLLDFAATKTFLQGGKVYILEKEEMPKNTKVLAIFRYPAYA